MINITITTILMIIVLFLLMIIMVVLYVKIRIFVVMLIVFSFSLIMGGMAIREFEIPFSPYLQIFFLLFQTIFFVLTTIGSFESGE